MLQCSLRALNFLGIMKTSCFLPWFLFFLRIWDTSPFILSTVSQLPLSLWWSLLLVLQWWVRATPSAALSVEQTLSAPPPPPTAGTMRVAIPGHKLGPPAPTASLVCDHTMLGSIYVRWQLPLPTWMETSFRVWCRISLCRVSCVTLSKTSKVDIWFKCWK